MKDDGTGVPHNHRNRRPAGDRLLARRRLSSAVWVVRRPPSGKITSTVGVAGAVLHPERRARGPQPSGSFVEALLGGLRALGGQGLHRVCGAPDDSFDVDLWLEGREDEIGDGSRVPTLRAADADP